MPRLEDRLKRRARAQAREIRRLESRPGASRERLRELRREHDDTCRAIRELELEYLRDGEGD